MDRFIRSPLRGWRWLFGILGIVTAGEAIYLFLDSPRAIEPRHTVILILQLLILIFGLVLAYVGLLASDDTVKKVARFTRRFGE